MELIGTIVILSYTAVVFWLGTGSGERKMLELLQRAQEEERSRRPVGFDFSSIEKQGEPTTARAENEKPV